MLMSYSETRPKIDPILYLIGWQDEQKGENCNVVEMVPLEVIFMFKVDYRDKTK